MVKLKPVDKDAQAKFRECDKVVKALRFAKAISQPDEDDGNVADSIDLSSMGACSTSGALLHLALALLRGTRAVVEPSYAGARLADDQNVTLEFVKQVRSSCTLWRRVRAASDALRAAQMIQDFRDEKVLHRRCVAFTQPCRKWSGWMCV